MSGHVWTHCYASADTCCSSTKHRALWASLVVRREEAAGPGGHTRGEDALGTHWSVLPHMFHALIAAHTYLLLHKERRRADALRGAQTFDSMRHQPFLICHSAGRI